MVLAARIQVFTTPILCVIWLAGLVLALVKFRISPRASILLIVGLFLAAFGQTLDALHLLSMDSSNNISQLMISIPGSFRLLKTIFNYAPSIFSIFAWGLILFAFVTAMGKEKKNES